MKTIILIINYNNHQDLVHCIGACQMLRYKDFHILVIENGSETTCIGQNKNWMIAQGLEQKEPLFFFSSWLSYCISPENLGFGKGNNLGFEKIKTLGWQPQFVWLLNNDAEPEPESLNFLEKTLESNPDAGFAGSLLLDYSKREVIQAAGGVIFPFMGITRHNLKGRLWNDIKKWPKETDYQCGASLLVRWAMIEKWGGFDPDYFLYFEETDWQFQMKQKGWMNILVPESKVYHAESKSTRHAPRVFFFHYFRSALIFLRKSYGGLIPWMGGGFLILVLVVRSGFRWSAIKAGLSGIWSATNLSLIKK